MGASPPSSSAPRTLTACYLLVATCLNAQLHELRLEAGPSTAVHVTVSWGPCTEKLASCLLPGVCIHADPRLHL